MSINNITPTLSNYIGNESIKRVINDNITIAKRKNTPFPHTLITGASGYGKTMLAHAIAHEMNVPIIEINCGNGNNVSPINTLLKAKDRSIIFFDEVHSLSTGIMENVLYRLMDENVIHIKYPDGNIESFKLPYNITIMSATTEPDKLPAPFVNRNALQFKLKSYTTTEMCSILKLNISTPITDEALTTLASATRNIPRMAVQYSNLINNYAYQYDVDKLTPSLIKDALSSWGIDEHGLTDDDRDYIKLIYDVFNNNPVGLNTLKSMLNMSEQQIISLENHLITEGYLIRSSRGRMLKGRGLQLAISLTTT